MPANTEMATRAQQDTYLMQATRIDPRITQLHWQKLDAASQQRFVSDQEQEYMILFDTDATETPATPQTASKARRVRDIATVQHRLRNLWPAHEVAWGREHRNLPMVKISLHNKTRLHDLLADASIISVTQDHLYQLSLTQSLPLVAQPQATAGGLSGEGVSIAVVDTSIDYTHPAFACTAPGVPSSCRIAHMENIAEPGDVFSQHGTLVAAIAAGMATNSKIIGLDVKGPSGILTSDLITAIDWIITHKDAYNIAVVNFSLGSTTTSAVPCNNTFDPLFVGFLYLQQAGVLSVAAAGNGGDADGISGPACYSVALSVGGTFDQDYASHTSCGGVSVSEDQVACFSNSAYFLDMLAPGATITATGYQGAGTSMAAPHVSGTAAMIMARFPQLNLNQLKTRLLDSSLEILDSRNGYSFPRLDLSRALKPDNDSFASAKPISLPQTISDTSVFATAQPDEAAGIQSSIWYRFTAESAAYLVKLTTASPLTVKIYQGSGSISQLTLIKTINPGDSTPLNLQAGVQYYAQVYSPDAGGLFDLFFILNSDETIPFLPAWALVGLVGAMLYRWK